MKSPYQNFVITDVETGGLPNSKNKAFVDVALTEIALVAVNSDLEIVDQGSWLVKPYKDGLIYDKGAEIASGISKKMCEEQGQDLAVVFEQVVKFFFKNKVGTSLPVLVGHNIIKFDILFFIEMFDYMKKPLDKYISKDVEDTIKWSRFMWPEAVNYKLGTCVDSAGITLTNAHRALTDTLATAKLFIHFMKNLRGVNGSVSKVVESKKIRVSFEI